MNAGTLLLGVVLVVLGILTCVMVADHELARELGDAIVRGLK